MNLVRWNPTRELRTVQGEMDRLMESFFRMPQMQEGWGLALDVVENEEGYTVRASIPGVAADELDITFENNVLTIKGEVKSDETSEDERVHIRERRYGSFARSIKLPVGVNSDAIEASHENGVLTLTLPKAEEVKPKRIEVKS